MVKKVAFNKEFLTKIKEQLLAKKEDLENELKVIASPNLNNKSNYEANFPELGDKSDENAAEVTEYTSNLQLEETLEKALKDVKQALERLEKKEYGICKYCKELINEKRLIARPVSSSCIDCKKKLTLEV